MRNNWLASLPWLGPVDRKQNTIHVMPVIRKVAPSAARKLDSNHTEPCAATAATMHGNLLLETIAQRPARQHF